MNRAQTQLKSTPAGQAAQLSGGMNEARRAQARGMSFAEGEALMSPTAGTASAPVQRSERADSAPKTTEAPQADLVQVASGQTKALEQDAPTTDGGGKTMGQDVVGGIEELNKSAALSPKNPGGNYNVAYRPAHPELPKGTKLNSQPNPYSGGTTLDFQFPEGIDEEERQRLEVEWRTAEDWKNGHVGDQGDYFENSNPTDGERFSWRLVKDVSASDALDIWLKGGNGDPTIADCATGVVAAQLNALRNKLGKAKFDALAKSRRTAYFICPNPDQTLLQFATSEIDLYKSEDKGTPGARPGLKEGDAVYFANHPDYGSIEPDGLWRGENCVYMGTNAEGEQLFSGFGVTSRTEAQMNEALVKHFNDAAHKSKTPHADISPAELLAAGGGLVTSRANPGEARPNPAGLRLDEEKVAKLASKI